MAVTIRMARRGATHRPFYHVVATDSRMPRDGRYLDKIGTYDPLGDKSIAIDKDKARKWLAVGATYSGAVKSLFKQAGVYDVDTVDEADAAVDAAAPADVPSEAVAAAPVDAAGEKPAETSA